MHLRSYTVYDEDGAEFALKLFINDEDSDSDSKEEDASNSTSASSTYFIDADSGWMPLFYTFFFAAHYFVCACMSESNRRTEAS